MNLGSAPRRRLATFTHQGQEQNQVVLWTGVICWHGPEPVQIVD